MARTRTLLGALCGWLLAGALALAAPIIDIDASLNTADAWIGDQVELRVTIAIEGNLRNFQVEQIALKPRPGLEILSAGTRSQQMQLDGISGEGRVEYQQIFYLKPTAAGEYVVGPVELAYTDAGTQQVERIAGPSLRVKDPYAPRTGADEPDDPAPATTPPATTPQGDPGDPAAQPAEEEGLRDIKDINPAPIPFGAVIFWSSIVAALLLTYLIYRLLTKSPAPIEALAIPPPPPGLLAETLAKLDAIPYPEHLADKAAVAAYYLAVTTLIKDYVHRRYHRPAPERTSWELDQDYRHLLLASGRPPASELQVTLERLLDLCDGGKYAQAFAEYGRLEEAKRLARHFLESDWNDVSETQVAGATPLSLESFALAGAAGGMAIRGYDVVSGPPLTGMFSPADLPRASREGYLVARGAEGSSTLFTPADSAAVVNRLAGLSDTASTSGSPP